MYRVWPVPLAGDLMFVCEWPGYGIAETRLVVPAADFSGACASRQAIWPT